MEGIKTDKKPILQGERGKFLEGTAPGPGRPKGSVSIMTQIKNFLEDNPDKMKELVDYYLDDKGMRALLLQMVDGRPSQQIAGDPERPLIIQVSKEIADKHDIA